jgi:hypothetical protein
MPWPDSRLVERNPRLDIFLLYRAGCLSPGAETRLKWPDYGTGGYLRASERCLILTGDFNQTIAWEEFSAIGGRTVRQWFRCSCGRGAYHLLLAKGGGVFACWRCCGYDRRSRRHQRGIWRSLRHIEAARKKLGCEDLRPHGDIPPRGCRKHHAPRERLLEALRRAEQAAYNDTAKMIERYDGRRTGRTKRA